MHAYDFILGIDEAGLGPILGPLTVGYAAFQLPAALKPDALVNHDLWQVAGIGREPAERKKRPVVCDSKKLYTPAKGVLALEEEVLAWAAVAGLDTSSWDALHAGLCPLQREESANYDWYAAPPQPFPLEAGLDRTRLRAQSINRLLDAANVKLAGFGVTPLLEGEFNRAIGRLGSKSKAEFEVICRVIADLWGRQRHMAVFCDRQGGRERYGHALHAEFPECDISALFESPKLSTYELSIPSVEGQPRLFIAFAEKGESRTLPVALASMGAKYVREVMMQQFNQWWAQHDGALKPTAGYYTDGKRWLQDTRNLRDAIGIPDNRIVRSR